MTRRVTASVALARGLYRAALRLHPRRFRRQYGAAMLATFDELAASTRGRRALALLALREVWDVAIAALRNRTPKRTVRRNNGRGEHVADFYRDCRYAVRTLAHQRGFSMVAILTLALGIGATTAVFTVVNGVLIRPLPYGDADRLVVLANGRAGRLSPWFSPPNYFDLTGESRAFGIASAFTPTTVNLTGGGLPERIDAASVTPEFFATLGVAMTHGRGFVAGDAASPDPTVVILSDGLWKRRFGGSAAIVGSAIQIDGRPCTVVGVAPRGVALPRRAELWRPLFFRPTDIAPPARGAQWISTVARLAPGVTLEQANGALEVVAARLAHEYPRTNKDRLAAAMPLHEQMVRAVKKPLLLLLGSVAFVLLIACVNVANLLLARSQARAREVAVRAALGAGRRRLVQQFLAESFVLAACGGLAGLGVAYALMRWLVLLAPPTIPRLGEVAIDARVLAFALLVAALTGVLFGLAPAIAASGAAMTRFVAAAGRGVTGGGHRTRRVLVVAELSLAVMLLVGAGLLVRSYVRLTSVNPGYEAARVLTFNVSLPEATYGELSQIRSFVSRLTETLAQQHGVESAAGIFGLPLDPDFTASSSFRREGEEDGADAPQAGMRIITPDYFEALRIPLEAGRFFTARDDERSPEVVIVNEEAARRYWPNQNPVGRQIKLGVRLVRGVESNFKTIVGVVGDVKYNGLGEAPPPEVYLPHPQHPVDGLTFVVRTSGDPRGFVPAARASVAALDRELPLAQVSPMTGRISRSVAERRFTMLLLAVFASVAVVLAAVGVYGVLSCMVSQRTQEIGVRMAIGASPGDLVWMFVRESATLAAVGVACGTAGAWAAASVMAAMLFEVSASDPPTFGAVAAILAAVALAAAYVPARRAAALDPIRALRVE